MSFLQELALDSNGNLIHINKTNKVNCQKYFCPSCNHEMIAKRGDIRKWHFAHKGECCSYNNYLHSVATILLKKWFDDNDKIILKINNRKICNKSGDCIFHDENNCYRQTMSEFDLKKYYTECYPEHKYGKFIADLYCHRDKKPPIFIEIFVTHECSIEKINSGIRIIEIKINSEHDIFKIINSNTLEQGPSVNFYNFSPRLEYDQTLNVNVYKYILYSSGKSYINANSTCLNYKAKRNGVYEISIPNHKFRNYFKSSTYDFMIAGRIMAYLDGYLDKDCKICKWQKQEEYSGKRFCKLYKKCGNPKYCEDNNVLQCSMFKINPEYTDSFYDTINAINNDPIIDIWKSENHQLRPKQILNRESIKKELARQNSYNLSYNQSLRATKIKDNFKVALSTQKFYCGDSTMLLVELGLICEQHITEFLSSNFKEMPDNISIKFFTNDYMSKLICIAHFQKHNDFVEYSLDFSDSDFIEL